MRATFATRTDRSAQAPHGTPRKGETATAFARRDEGTVSVNAGRIVYLDIEQR